MTITAIVQAVEEYAPRALQESWDNTGWQISPQAVTSGQCSGVMLCLDVTPAVVAEARSRGCNLIISHHPLLFRGPRTIDGSTPGQRALVDAIRAGIAVYSSHTALDSAPGGVSHHLGTLLSLTDMRPLSPSHADPSAGLGIIGTLPGPGITLPTLIDRVKQVYRQPALRVTPGPACDPALSPATDVASPLIHTIALCSGSGGEFITDAISAGADAYITSDVRYHDFLDHGRDIIIVDTGHFESEICTKSIFSHIISQKFPNFAVYMATCEHPPVQYV